MGKQTKKTNVDGMIGISQRFAVLNRLITRDMNNNTSAPTFSLYSKDNITEYLTNPYTYEFSVDSANFVFAQEFAPFRNRLELGKGVYLNVGGKQTITPYIIEFELDFEKHSNFSVVFSNRFKRKDYVNTLKDMRLVQKSFLRTPLL